jgi:hypothetical protein
MSNITTPTWLDTLSPPRNIDTIEYRVKLQLPYSCLPKPGEHMYVWRQGEKFVNINGGLRSITMKNIDEWEFAGLIVRW